MGSMRLIIKVMKRQNIFLIFPKGQILVMALLVSVIGLTIGLSIASRSISGLQQTGTFEASNRAFSAAEAGIEQALQQLKTATPIPGVPIPTAMTTLTENKSSFNYSVEPLGSGTAAYQVDGVLKDDSVEVKLSGGNGGLGLYWNLPQDPVALVANFVYPQAGSYSIKTFALVCGSSAASYGGFEQIPVGSYTIGSSIYRCLKNFTNADIPNNVSALRLKVLCTSCSSVNLAAQPTGSTVFPPQSYLVRSVGDAAGTQRTVEATETLQSLPAIFDYTIFSTSLTSVLSK